MAKNRNEEKLPAIINISDFAVGSEDHYKIDKEVPWINELCLELDKLIEDNLDDEITPSEIDAEITVKRKHAKPYADHVLIEGHINAYYQQHCVRCLQLIDQEIETEFYASFIHEHFEKDPEYEESVSIYSHDKEYDLFFLKKGKMDLKGLINEQIFSRVHPLPLHDENCKGLCQTCGNNLNESDCGHRA